jgi:L-alanine-DL-glutamate epimerase-like enolase superfamily enzyme
MNATEDIGWLDDAAVLDATVERLKIVKNLGLNAGLDFHGRLHRPMAKQLAKALEPYRPLFIEVSQDLYAYRSRENTDFAITCRSQFCKTS